MTEREKNLEEFLERIKNADTDTLLRIIKLLKLFQHSSGFKAALKEATPPGEDIPPSGITSALINKWIELEGLE